MKYSVVIDPKAKNDIRDIFLYVRKNDGGQAAGKLLTHLEDTCNKPEQFPERGHIPPELIAAGIKRYLEIHYKPYRIIYELVKTRVYIHAVIDGRRSV